MDWYILLIVVPLVLVPIVLLCGFSGCAQIAGLEPIEHVLLSPPSSVSARASGTDRVRVRWPFEVDTTYRVERAPDPGTFLTVTDGTTDFFFDDTASTGLVEGRTFRYRVSKTQVGSTSAPSAEVRVTTLPHAPTGLLTRSANVRLVQLDWLNRTANPHVRFRVERRAPGGTFQQVGPLIERPTQFVDTDAVLTTGSQHEYQVVAVIPEEFAFDNDVPADVASESSAPHLVTIA